MYSLYFIAFQMSGTRPVTKPLRSIRPEQRGTFHTQFWLIAYGDLVQRSCQETFYRDLAQESSYRDQRSCQETSSRDLVQRLGEESSDLAQRSFIESLNWDLTLRSLVKIFCGDLLQTPCTDSLTQGSCTAASTENLSRRSCARSSTDIFTQGTCNLTWHLFFQRPPWMNMLSLLGSLVSC